MSKKKIPLALQLYSVREDCSKNFVKVLEEVAKMGYQGVEFAGYWNMTAGDLRKVLDANGLKVAGTHTGIQTLLGDEFEKTVAFNKEIGNKFLIVPGLPEEYRKDLDSWKKTAGIFNEISDKLQKYGMKTGYHNHHIEFGQTNGTCPWDVFFSNSKKEVIMQVDTGNAMHAGVDVTPFVEKYPGRAITVHLKEYTKDGKGAPIGEGDFPWKKFFQLCETIGNTEWYIVEQEVYNSPPMECVKKCIDNLRKMGK